MSVVKIPYKTGRTDLRLDTDLLTAIRALPGLAFWAQAETSRVTLTDGTTLGVGTQINNFNDVNEGGTNMSRRLAAARAILTPNSLNGWSVADFVRAEADSYLWSGTLNADLPFSFVVFARVDDVAANQAIMSCYSTDDAKAMFYIPASGSTFRWQYGTTKWLTGPLTVGSYQKIIGTFDGTRIKLRVGNVLIGELEVVQDGWSASVTLGAQTPAGANAFDGKLSDTLIFTTDILANDAALALIDRYAEIMYRL